MSNYYIKNGRKYIPVGFDGPSLHDGIWLVKSNDHCKSSKNLVRFVGYSSSKDTLLALSACMDLEKEILDIIMNETSGPFTPVGLAEQIILTIFKKETAIRKKYKRKTKEVNCCSTRLLR